MKKQNEVDDPTKERANRCNPLVGPVLQILFQNDLSVGDIMDKSGNVKEEDNKKYNKAAEEIIELMLENDLNFVDKEYLFAVVGQVVEVTKQRVLGALDRSYNVVLKKVLGKDMFELKLKDLDKILTEK